MGEPWISARKSKYENWKDSSNQLKGQIEIYKDGT